MSFPKPARMLRHRWCCSTLPAPRIQVRERRRGGAATERHGCPHGRPASRDGLILPPWFLRRFFFQACFRLQDWVLYARTPRHLTGSPSTLESNQSNNEHMCLRGCLKGYLSKRKLIPINKQNNSYQKNINSYQKENFPYSFGPGLLVPWSLGPFIPDPLVLWSLGPLDPWSSGPLVLWSVVLIFGSLGLHFRGKTRSR